VRKRLRVVTRLNKVLNWYRWLESIACVGGLALLVSEFGLYENYSDLIPMLPLLELLVVFVLLARALLTYLLLDLEVEGADTYYARGITSRLPHRIRTMVNIAGLETMLAALAVALALAAPFMSEPIAWLSNVMRLLLLSLVFAWAFRTIQTVQRLPISPLILFTATYSCVVLAGALLLMLPRATEANVSIGLVDAIFMSSSASCVTGLSLYDIGEEFTLFGQLVILALIQIGGLGIMTFAAFASLASGAGLSLKDRVAMGEVLNYEGVGRIGRLIAWILGITFVCEAVGVIWLYGTWTDAMGNALPAGQQWYFSIFHSISAFCNAGFSLHGDSLSRYSDDVSTLLPIGLLIILGGLGFTVIMDLVRYKPWLHPMARRWHVLGRFARGKPLPRLKLQTKIVLFMTFGLTVFGTVGFWLLEYDGVLANDGGGSGFWDTLFQGGITPRTAGFNSLDYSEMKPATHFFTILMMVVGASPGSTGGGLKTTAVAIILLALWNTFRQRPVEVFRRRIADEQVRRVLVLLFIALIVLNGAVFALTITEQELLQHQRGFMQMTFEVVSAFATVGLSTGATAEFTEPGKLILAFCMFFGRIGPLTLVLAIGRRRSQPYEFPTENVMIG